MMKISNIIISLSFLFTGLILGSCEKENIVEVPGETITDTVYIKVPVEGRDTIYIDNSEPANPDDGDYFNDYPVEGSAPSWTVVSDQTQYSMTLERIPNYKDYRFEIKNGDQLGAFSDNECCGTATIKNISGKNIFYLMIHQDKVTSEAINIRYYNSERKMLFSGFELTFSVDKILGSPDDPYIFGVE